jgi:MoCo/4Fe-4S cofactor protein with predicted Tat translocation signal
MSDPRERYWRDLEQLLGEPETAEALSGEFPRGADLPPDWMGRRNFVKLLGASLALAGIGGCVSRPRERILPYVTPPSEPAPALAEHYATAMVLEGYATGLLVESHAGRPTKIEGNPDHPASLGAAGVFEQASLLGLYDPQRARTVRSGGRRSTWAAFRAAIGDAEIRRRTGARGSGLHLLVEPDASSLQAWLLHRVRERYPDAHIHFYAPLASDAERVGTTSAFGRAVQPVYDLSEADVILAVGADFLSAAPFHLRYARDFARRRRIAAPADGMNRLYAIETALTVTGGMADHRLRARPGEVPSILAAIAAQVAASPPAPAAGEADGWAHAVAVDLVAHPGRSAVIVGPRQPAVAHALAHALNLALDNVGRTVRYIEPPLSPADPGTGIGPLADAMRAGEASCVLVLGGNPVYTAPADLDFGRLLERVPSSACAGLYRDETAEACRWFVPSRHYLEAWGDARAWDGTASLVQPLVAPLYAGHGPTELLAARAGEAADPHTLLREHWRRRWPGRDFDHAWDAALQRGVIPDTAAAAVQVRRSRSIGALLQDVARVAHGAGRLELAFAPDPSVHDGRFGNNPWLQELPDPVTKLTWGNAAMLSRGTAARLGVGSGDLLRIAANGRTSTFAALVVPGHADAALTLPLGYGRPVRAGAEGHEQVAAGVGANAYALRSLADPFSVSDASVEPLLGPGGPRRAPLALTQQHWRMEGRPIALAATLEDYRRKPIIAPGERERALSLYQPDQPSAPEQWAMVIDLSACTGCSACVVACQAENNVPVVGREGVLQSREMHWLRIDRYFAGTADDPLVLTQPMLCQHCEKAPCEYVCPVSATVHSPDGINEMVYNRCVGTRFCSNNCPYKVRRFNWFDYNAEVSETERLAKNPDVTVRARGVMEKCTFCVQRVREAQIGARLDDRPVRSGEVRTACQQACPTQAIVFGSAADPADEVTRWRDHPRAYSVLHELGTEPRVRYLARITNPNPRLESGST